MVGCRWGIARPALPARYHMTFGALQGEGGASWQTGTPTLEILSGVRAGRSIGGPRRRAGGLRDTEHHSPEACLAEALVPEW
jgi:hypothetical protein